VPDQAVSEAPESYAGGGATGTESFFSVAACRPGTASRSTSDRVPAYRSATSAASAAIAGCSTGSALTTRRNGLSEPPCSLVAPRSRTNPSTSRPAKRTLTRTPGRASSAIEAGTA
jgi:hypothetical protein